MRSHQELPNDIYELILDCVGPDWRGRRDTMKAMSLANRSLTHLCQKRLFRKVNFYFLDRARNLMTLWDESPHLLDHVRDLSFHCYECVDDDGCWLEETAPPEFVVQFLRRFHGRLLSLDVSFEYENSMDGDIDSVFMMEWKNVPPQVASGILDLLRSQSLLRDLSIYLVLNIPSHVISSLKRSCPCLESLNFVAITVDFMEAEVNNVNSVVPIQSIKRCTLGKNGGQALLQPPNVPGRSLIPLINFSELQTLRIDWKTEEDVIASRSILRLCSRLQNLKCKLRYFGLVDFQGLAKAILNGPYKTLQSISFAEVSGTDIHLKQHEPDLCSIDTELMELSGNMIALQQISIVLALFFDAQEAVRETMYGLCKKLNDILSKANAFPSLRRLTISFRVVIEERDYGQRGNRVSESWMVEFKKECFSNFNLLTEMSSLEFTFKIIVDGLPDYDYWSDFGTEFPE